MSGDHEGQECKAVSRGPVRTIQRRGSVSLRNCRTSVLESVQLKYEFIRVVLKLWKGQDLEHFKIAHSAHYVLLNNGP